MTCPRCGHAMATGRENVDYDVSGLPGVTLVGVEVGRCSGCGHHEVAIPRIAELHRVMARAVVGKTTRLTAAEIRFLRKSLGWSSRDFADHMGTVAETVSRWENGRTPMGAQADRLLRLMVLHVQPAEHYELAELKDIDRDAPAAELCARLVEHSGDWAAEAA